MTAKNQWRWPLHFDMATVVNEYEFLSLQSDRDYDFIQADLINTLVSVGFIDWNDSSC